MDVILFSLMTVKANVSLDEVVCAEMFTIKISDKIKVNCFFILRRLFFIQITRIFAVSEHKSALFTRVVCLNNMIIRNLS